MATPSWLLRAAAACRAATSVFIRKYVRADLVESDRFLDPGIFAPMWARPATFLESGTSGRWFEIAWRAFLLCAAGGLSLVFVSILAEALSQHRPPLASLAVLILLGLTLWGVLSAQAHLRWMLRNRKRPRGARVEAVRLR